MNRNDQTEWSSREFPEKWYDRVTHVLSIQQSTEESRIVRQSQPEHPATLKAHLNEYRQNSDLWSKYNIPRSSDESCDRSVKEWSSPYPHALVWHQMYLVYPDDSWVTRNWGRSRKSENLQISIESGNMPQYGIKCVTSRENQMMSNHASTDM